MERSERQRLEVDLKAAQTSQAAEIRETRDRLAAAEQASCAAKERAQQAAAERDCITGQLTEAQDAVKVLWKYQVNQHCTEQPGFCTPSEVQLPDAVK